MTGTGVGQSEVELFRRQLALFGQDPSGSMNSDLGVLLWQRFRTDLAVQVAAYARHELNYRIEADDAAHILIVELLSRPELAVRLGIADPTHPDYVPNPAGYLYTSASVGTRTADGGTIPGWVRAEVGCLTDTTLDHPDRPHDSALVYRVAPGANSHGLTPLNDVVTLTTGFLAPRTPHRFRAGIYDLVHWLALNPPQRKSYEGETIVAAINEFPTMNPSQITATANIALGGRPAPQQTSLFYHLLNDPEFRPADTAGTFRALVTYQQRVSLLQAAA